MTVCVQCARLILVNQPLGGDGIPAYVPVLGTDISAVQRVQIVVYFEGSGRALPQTYISYSPFCFYIFLLRVTPTL